MANRQLQTLRPNSVKVVIPITNVDPRQKLGASAKVIDLGWAIRNGLIQIQAKLNGKSPALASAPKAKTTNGNGHHKVYVLKKLPKKDRVQPQMFTILSTLKQLGGKAERERLLQALSTKLKTNQEVATVLSLKRKAMVDAGYLLIKEQVG